MHKYVSPSYKNSSFNCPHCHSYSHQIWCETSYYSSGYHDLKNHIVAFCSHCHQYSIWLNQKMIHPDSSSIQSPNSDLAQDIIDDYLEAANIINRSPRGAVALLRLAIQKLCKQLGEQGKNINDDIANLVQKGLPSTIQKALDIVRVIGNEAVHPGQIDLKDDQETASKLFDLINIIANVMITQPKEIAALYEILPEDKRAGIADRDKKNK